MRAALYREFAGPITIEDVPDPAPAPNGAVIEVKASGLCRSDWHGWKGHDADITTLPHVPGHEFAGVVAEVGKEVRSARVGDRVTLPFVCACGRCPQCISGNQQICDRQFQPGFTHWGSFAQLVTVGRADINLVALPVEIDFVAAASLGCRFTTSFRAMVDQAKVSPGKWVAVHGCGGVGLSAIMIASALGARVIAIDIATEKLDFARTVGAHHTIHGDREKDVAKRVREISGGGAHVSVDALGNSVTCCNSILGLRKRGKHIQVGLLSGAESMPAIPMDAVISNELEILGSHGMQAHRYAAMLEMILARKLQPAKLVGKTIHLDELPTHLAKMDVFSGTGATVVDRFR
jgi:alcohol dehydrogenase